MIFISIVGPTSSGKSSLSIHLAKYLQSLNKRVVVISADSRQVYKHLNLGTGKVEGDWQNHPIFKWCFVFEEVPHFLIDYTSLKTEYSLNTFLNDYCNLFENWQTAGILPEYVIVCGGTGLYASAIANELKLNNFNPKFLPEIETLKKSLQNLNTEILQNKLIQLNSDIFEKMNLSDRSNPRRLQNQIINLVAEQKNWLQENNLIYPYFNKNFEFLIDKPDLKNKIEQRINERLEHGMLKETLNLIQTNILNFNDLDNLGLEYRLQKYYFLGLLTLNELKRKMLIENLNLAKKQRTWFKQQKNLVAVDSFKEILDLIG